MVAMYGDDALQGMEHFVADPAREAVIAPELCQNMYTRGDLACWIVVRCYPSAWPALIDYGCMQEIARVLDETWALVKDQPDAIKLYGSNPSRGMEFNSLFRKTLSRKFNEVIIL